MAKYANIIVDISLEKLDKTFQYKVPRELAEELSPGMLVEVPFGNRKVRGFVLELTDEISFDEEKLKEISGIVTKGVSIEGQLIALADWMHTHCGGTMNQALKTVLPVKKKVKARKTAAQEEAAPQKQPIVLNPQQTAIAKDIFFRWKAGDYKPSLLFGVTGSGKTQVYMALIEAMRREGKQAIVLIPEIALTFQTVQRFKNHFGERVAVLHSRLSEGERFAQYQRAKTGEVDVLVGPRSALFAPFSNLGLIVIDEEHESSYKSESVPCYHARETAIARAALCGAAVVLGSATPSVESYFQAQTGVFSLYEMKERVESRPLPTVHTVDLREELRNGNKSILSEQLKSLMEERLAKGEQTMLFLNRRGMAGFVSCRSCGEAIKCPHCDVSLHLHQGGRLLCHYCGYSYVVPKKCPSCQSPYIGAFRAGTQKIEQFLQKEFPTARILRMDYDTTRKKDGFSAILSAFSKGEADILIGTQMIVKGHDFPNVTLVGVLAADLSLHVGDFRAAERTFQLLVQAAGRAGRGNRKGEVVIQTYQPENYAIVAAAKQDYDAFFREEMQLRALLHYPPQWHLLAVFLTCAKEGLVNEAARMLQCALLQNKALSKDLQLIGPAEAQISRICDQHRRVLYVKGEKEAQLLAVKDAFEGLLCRGEVDGQVFVQFQMNPMQLW